MNQDRQTLTLHESDDTISVREMARPGKPRFGMVWHGLAWLGRAWRVAARLVAAAQGVGPAGSLPAGRFVCPPLDVRQPTVTATRQRGIRAYGQVTWRPGKPVDEETAGRPASWKQLHVMPGPVTLELLPLIEPAPISEPIHC